MNQQTIEEGKTMAIVSYLTLIGTLVAFFMNQEKKNPFTAFHTRQALGLWLLQMILGYVVSGFDSWNITFAFWIAIAVLLFYGVFTAIMGKAEPIPLLGNLFQKIFASLGR
ncbi:MAG TPA: hypothetical protein VKZ98_09370 [Aquaticitalea sp.]|nr:hypothetical protein [Aquaticitalea sp.]